MRLRHLALPAAGGLALLAIPFAPAAQAATACVPADNSCTAVFQYTGGAQSFTVPRGVTNLLVAIGGASGGDGLDGDGTPQGGAGGALEAIVPVTAGQVLTLVVGGKGGDAVAVDATPTSPIPPVAAGGYGGGGAGTSAVDGPVGGGGGGSFLFSGNTLLLAAGGGGGAGYTGTATAANDGGAGGAGAAGVKAAGANGGGGASTTGGAAGAGGDGTKGSGPATGPTAFGRGGASAGTCSAGGGGGGWFGGGSGGCVTVPVDSTVAKTTSTATATTTATAKAGDAKAAPRAAATPAVVPQESITTAGGGGGGAGFLGQGVSKVADFPTSTSALDNGVIGLLFTSAATTTTLSSDVTTLAPGQEATLDAKVAGPELTIGDPADAASPAARVATAAFGAQAAALAVPVQPAAPGTTINPATACRGPLVPLPSGVQPTACTVTFFVNGTQLDKPIEIDATTGVASVIFTAGSTEGVRHITARYDGNLYYLSSASAPYDLTVAGLANTGTQNIVPMLGISAGLLVAGAGLVAFGRRRPQLGAHHAA